MPTPAGFTGTTLNSTVRCIGTPPWRANRPAPSRPLLRWQGTENPRRLRLPLHHQIEVSSKRNKVSCARRSAVRGSTLWWGGVFRNESADPRLANQPSVSKPLPIQKDQPERKQLPQNVVPLVALGPSKNTPQNEDAWPAMAEHAPRGVPSPHPPNDGPNRAGTNDGMRPQPEHGSEAVIVAAINTGIRDGWGAAELSPSPVADDAEWIRRVHLDLIGHIPPPDVVEEFLKGRREQAGTQGERAFGRSRLRPQFRDRVDEHLGGPVHGAGKRTASRCIASSVKASPATVPGAKWFTTWSPPKARPRKTERRVSCWPISTTKPCPRRRSPPGCFSASRFSVPNAISTP